MNVKFHVLATVYNRLSKLKTHSVTKYETVSTLESPLVALSAIKYLHHVQPVQLLQMSVQINQSPYGCSRSQQYQIQLLTISAIGLAWCNHGQEVYFPCILCKVTGIKSKKMISHHCQSSLASLSFHRSPNHIAFALIRL